MKKLYQRDSHNSLNLRTMSKLNKRSGVLTAVTIKITVIWELAACSSVPIRQTARRHIAEYHNLDTKYFYGVVLNIVIMRLLCLGEPCYNRTWQTKQAITFCKLI
jgi:hypothetical protein